MGYVIKGDKDMWDNVMESHYTQPVEEELDFEDIVEGININFEDGETEYYNELNNKLKDKEVILTESLGVDTDDASLYFKVVYKDGETQKVKLTPKEFELKHDNRVDLEDIYDKDDSKIEDLILEYYNLD